MKKNFKGTILNNEQIAKDTYKLIFKSDLKEARAGQFCSILCENKTLRRPFSIANFNNGEIELLYKIKGEGTEYISNLKVDETIDFLAPLGNRFDYSNTKKALLIGAGIGIAPMLFLKKELDKKRITNYLISGFKNNSEVIEGSNETIIGGSVMDNIDEVIKEFKPDTLYSCGPSIVLKLVCKAAERNNIKAQIAMEKVMACGIGVCRGCIIELKNGKNASICKDGPIFDGDIIKW